MTFKTYEINVDLVHDSSTISTIQFSQNDRNSAKLLLTITNKGTELDLSQAKSIRMSFKKPDGTRVFQNDCQPVNALKGEYQILLKTQTLAAVGTVIAQIHIEEEDRTIDTQKFFFIVSDSLASDKAIESTNEFTIIQKAIEAGEKLEGVDINGIIAAGAKADGALPKTGGTMTGNIEIANGKGLYFQDSIKAPMYAFYQNNGDIILRDIKNSITVFAYSNVSKLLNVPSDTNLLKTTGGTMTGGLTLPVLNTNTKEPIKMKTPGKLSWLINTEFDAPVFLPSTQPDGEVWDWANQINIKNLAKKTGDTFTGEVSTTSRFTTSGSTLIATRTSDKVNWILNLVNSSGDIVLAPSATVGGQDWNWSKQVTFTKDGVVKSAKDGRVDLVLTADVENFNGNVGPIADRYGNTVTFRAGLRRKVGATGTLVTTLPADMRPTMTVFSTTVSNDGVPARVVVNSNGDVHLENAGVATISGKDVYIAITYVVK